MKPKQKPSNKNPAEQLIDAVGEAIKDMRTGKKLKRTIVEVESKMLKLTKFDPSTVKELTGKMKDITEAEYLVEDNLGEKHVCKAKFTDGLFIFETTDGIMTFEIKDIVAAYIIG